MPAHLPPPPSRSRRLGALALAVVVGLLAVVLVNRPAGDDDESPIDTEQDSTVPSVLGSIVEQSPTTLAPADPAAPATFPSTTVGTVAPTRRPPSTVTTSPPATLVPPVSISWPPRTISPSTETTVDGAPSES